MDFTQQALENLIAFTGDPEIENKTGAFLYYKQYWGWPTEIEGKPGHFRDDFGVEWNRNGADKENDDRFIMYGFGFSMFERAWSIMGMENVLCSMITVPEATEKFFEKIGDYFCRLVDIALEYDFDGIYDWGQQHGLIMGLEHWRHYIKPQMARLYKKVKDKRLFAFQHSCGDCHELFPDLIESGLDCYQTFQPEVYDVREMKKLYGDRLAFWGGISTQQCLPYATLEQVKEEIVKLYHQLHEGGGYILAPTHALAFDVPPGNILAMIEMFNNQEKHLK